MLFSMYSAKGRNDQSLDTGSTLEPQETQLGGVRNSSVRGLKAGNNQPVKGNPTQTTRAMVPSIIIVRLAAEPFNKLFLAITTPPIGAYSSSRFASIVTYTMAITDVTSSITPPIAAA